MICLHPTMICRTGRSFKLLVSLVAIYLTLQLLLPFAIEDEQEFDKQFLQHEKLKFTEQHNWTEAKINDESYKSKLEYEASYSVLTHTIFFNMFFNGESYIKKKKSFKIVNDQLNDFPNGTQVFYNVIGAKPPQQICSQQPHLQCNFLKYYKQGDEVLTLQALYEFCTQHPLHRVTYVHNKGSFHQSAGNHYNRIKATQGAVSSSCLEMPLNPQWPCNICGSKFQYRPHFHYSANMWTAECGYIKDLFPPNQYEQKRRNLLQKLWQEYPCLGEQVDKTMEFNSYAWNLTDPQFLRNVGLGRYAMERWMTNSPNMIPCEVCPAALIQQQMDNLRLGEPKEWGKMVSWKVKSRENWLLQQEYSHIYPNFSINGVLRKDQERPRPKPCWP